MIERGYIMANLFGLLYNLTKMASKKIEDSKYHKSQYRCRNCGVVFTITNIGKYYCPDCGNLAKTGEYDTVKYRKRDYGYRGKKLYKLYIYIGIGILIAAYLSQYFLNTDDVCLYFFIVGFILISIGLILRKWHNRKSVIKINIREDLKKEKNYSLIKKTEEDIEKNEYTPCPECNKPLILMPKTNLYYCYRCRKYKE